MNLEIPVLAHDTGHLGVGKHRERPSPLALLSHQRPRSQRVHDPHARRVEAPEDEVLVDEGDQVLDLVGREQLGRLTPRLS